MNPQDVINDFDASNQTTEVVNCCFVKSIVQDIIDVIDKKSPKEDAGEAQDVISDVIKYVIECFDQQTNKPKQNYNKQDVIAIENADANSSPSKGEQQSKNSSRSHEQQDVEAQNSILFSISMNNTVNSQSLGMSKSQQPSSKASISRGDNHSSDQSSGSPKHAIHEQQPNNKINDGIT